MFISLRVLYKPNCSRYEKVILLILLIISLWSCKKKDDASIKDFPNDILGSWKLIDTYSSERYWEFNDNGNVYELWKGNIGENMANVSRWSNDNDILKIVNDVFQYSIKNDTLSLTYNNSNLKFKRIKGISYDSWINKIEIKKVFQLNNANHIISLAWTGVKMWALDTVCDNPTELNKYYRAYLVDIDLNQGIVLKRNLSITNIYPCAITCNNDTLLMSISREFNYYNPVSGSFIRNDPDIFIGYISGLCSKDNELLIYELPPYGFCYDNGDVSHVGKVHNVYDIAYGNSFVWLIQKKNRLLKYDLNVKSVVKTYELDANMSSDILCLEFTDKDLWVVDNKNRFYKIRICDL